MSRIGERYVGRRVRRKEDRRLLTGAGKFVADLSLEGIAEVVFVRSSFAHARIRDIDTSAAAAAEGVLAILTSEDVRGKIEPFTRFVDQERTPPELERAARPVVKPCPMEVLGRTGCATSASRWWR